MFNQVLTHRYASILGLVCALFCVELIRTAWICDDAAISLRCVMNFIHGYGPTYNIDERVQVFTHPLWFFLISGFTLLTRNIFVSVFVLSLMCALLSLWLLLFRVSTQFWAGILASCILMLSKAYVDFSTSGLENSLSHCLIFLNVFFAVNVLPESTQKNMTRFFLSLGLLYLNRPDLPLLFIPTVLVLCYQQRIQSKKLISAMLIGGVPVICWSLFSLFYYGFLFPNTAYAKLGMGVPHTALFSQGFDYFLDSIDRDPLTLTAIFTVMIVGFCGSNKLNKCFSFGLLLYLFYVFYIGGDFMSGRFLTAPLCLAMAILARAPLKKIDILALFIGALILGSFTLKDTFLSNASYDDQHVLSHGIANERAFYYQQWGLLSAKRYAFIQPNWERQGELSVKIYGALGFSGLATGPNLHILDPLALSDPLLARLSGVYHPDWRIGHVERVLPAGFEQTLTQHQNVLVDPMLKSYYDALKLVTQGSLWDKNRLWTIVKMNLGLIPRLQIQSDAHHQFALMNFPLMNWRI